MLAKCEQDAQCIWSRGNLQESWKSSGKLYEPCVVIIINNNNKFLFQEQFNLYFQNPVPSAYLSFLPLECILCSVKTFLFDNIVAIFGDD